MLRKLVRREPGQALAEYTLILVMVAVVVMGTLLILGPAIGGIFSVVKQAL